MALPNIINVAQIYGYSTGKLLTTSNQDILTNTTNQSMKVNTIMVSNITASAVNCSIYYYESSVTTAWSFVTSVTIPANASLDVLARPFYLKESDKIQALAGTGNSVHLVLSYETIA